MKSRMRTQVEDAAPNGKVIRRRGRRRRRRRGCRRGRFSVGGAMLRGSPILAGGRLGWGCLLRCSGRGTRRLGGRLVVDRPLGTRVRVEDRERAGGGGGEGVLATHVRQETVVIVAEDVEGDEERRGERQHRHARGSLHGRSESEEIEPRLLRLLPRGGPRANAPAPRGTRPVARSGGARATSRGSPRRPRARCTEVSRVAARAADVVTISQPQPDASLGVCAVSDRRLQHARRPTDTERTQKHPKNIESDVVRMAVTTPPRGRIGTLHGETIMFAKGISSMPLAVRAPSPTVTAGESVPLLRREPEDRPPPSTRRNVSAIVAGGVLVAVRSNLPRLAPTPPLRAAAHSPAPPPLLFPSLRFSWRWCVSPRSRGAARDPPRAPAPRIANVPPRRCRTRRDATNAPSPRRPTRTQNTNPSGRFEGVLGQDEDGGDAESQAEAPSEAEGAEDASAEAPAPGPSSSEDDDADSPSPAPAPSEDDYFETDSPSRALPFDESNNHIADQFVFEDDQWGNRTGTPFRMYALAAGSHPVRRERAKDE